MTEEAAGVLLADHRESQMRGFEEGIQCPGLRLTQRLLYLREGLLYRVVVRRPTAAGRGACSATESRYVLST